MASGANMLPQRVVEDAFRLQHGRTLNFAAFGESINRLNDWYKHRGLLGQVLPYRAASDSVLERLRLTCRSDRWLMSAGCCVCLMHSNRLVNHQAYLFKTQHLQAAM